MKKESEFTTFDPAEYLEDDQDIAIFLDEAFKSGNVRHIVDAIGAVARAKGMTEIAKKSGIRREQLYQAFGENGNPTLQTLIPVLRALNLDLGTTAHQSP